MAYQHCGQDVHSSKSLDPVLFHLKCEKCGATESAKTAKAVENQWMKRFPEDKPMPPAPRTPVEKFAVAMKANAKHIMEITAPFVAEDKPAFARLMTNNIRYISGLNAYGFNKVWGCEEGQMSLVRAAEDAMILGAELGKMGSIVPFGTTAEFIPAIEAFDFAATNGKNAPFKWINIELIYEKDDAKALRKNGEFTIEVTPAPGNDRGPVRSVAVYGLNTKRGMVIGEIYAAKRLIEKAKIHSESYKRFLDDKAGIEQARMDGKIKTKGGREYIVEARPAKGGGTYDKKIFIDELATPWEGPDPPEMLRKSAGKNFLNPYIKVRNSEAMAAEMEGEGEESIDAMIDKAIDGGARTVDEAPEMREAVESLKGNSEALDAELAGDE